MSDSSGDVFEVNIEADGNSGKKQENKTSERPPVLPVPPKPKPKESQSAELLIFVKGIPKSCTAKNLTYFLEAKSRGEVKELIFGVEPGTAIATLEKNSEFTRLQMECKKKLVDGSFLVVHKIPKPSAIIVSSEQPVDSMDSVKYYFENKRRSDGGDVSKCEKTECGSIIVYFKDEIVVSRVCAKSRSHEVDNVKLTVSPVYRHGEWNVWDVSLHSVHVPEPVSLVDIDKKKLNFLKANTNEMSQLSNRLSNVMAELVLIDDGKVNLKCLLTSTAKDIREHVKNWKEIAVNTFTEYLSQRIGVQTVKVFSAAWPEFITRIKEINSEDASHVIVICQEIQYTLEIVGHVENVDTLAKHMTQIKQEIEAKVHCIDSQTTGSLQIPKMPVLFLLRDQNIFKEICGKFKDLQIEPDFTSGHVKFQGVSEDIQSAKIQVMQEIMDLTESKFGSMSSYQLKLLQRPKVENYIKNKLDAKGLTGRWQVDGSKIITVVLSGVNIESFEKLLEDSILQSEVDLLEKSAPLLTNPMWESKIQELCMDDKILVEYEENMLKTIVLIVSTDDIHDNTVQNVRQFIENTDLDRSISFDPIKLRYLRSYCGKELEEIENSKLIGTAGKLEIAKSKLRTIQKRIIHMPHMITKPGINKFIHSEKGISIISTVEDQCKCVIRLKDDYVNAERREFFGLTPAMETKVATSIKSTVVMDIYSESKSCIFEAQEMLEVKIRNEFITKDVTDECIKDLSKEEIKNIKELMTMYPVEIEVQQSRNRIYLSGTPVIVMDMVDKIQKILRLHREKKNRESQAVMLANAIQWCFQTTREGTQIQKYDNETNLRLEMAYRDGKDEVELRDETGVLYIVDMTRMKEYRFDNPEDEVDVLRRDKIIGWQEF